MKRLATSKAKHRPDVVVLVERGHITRRIDPLVYGRPERTLLILLDLLSRTQQTHVNRERVTRGGTEFSHTARVTSRRDQRSMRIGKPDGARAWLIKILRTKRGGTVLGRVVLGRGGERPSKGSRSAIIGTFATALGLLIVLNPANFAALRKIVTRVGAIHCHVERPSCLSCPLASSCQFFTSRRSRSRRPSGVSPRA